MLSKMSEEKCLMCRDSQECEEKAKKTSQKRASRTAHQLASDQAEVGYAGLEWIEIYTLFFARIFKHEFERNLKLERAIEFEKNTLRHQDDPNVCDYHYENVVWLGDGLHDECMKEARHLYATSKWPKKQDAYK